MATNNHKKDEVTNLEILEFLEEHMVMKEDFDELKKEVGGLKEDVSGLKQRMVTKDDLKVETDKVFARFSVIDRELEDIKVRLSAVEKTLKEDVDANVSEIDKLKKRVAALERELGTRRVALQQ